MTSRNLSILGLAAIVVLALALWLAYPRSSGQKSDLLYPTLKGELSQVTAIHIHAAGDTPVVELKRNDSNWQIAERYGYPADNAKVRRLLQSLADAKLIEEKTSNAANYAALGVEDMSGATAAGARVELVGTSAPVNLIVGKTAGMKGSYVRRAGEAPSWLTNDSIEAATRPQDWLQTSVVDVSADRVQSATVTIASAKPYTAAKDTRADADFAVDGLSRGKQADSSTVSTLATALAGLTLADVRPAKDFATDTPAAHATFRTFDGLIIDLDGWTKDDKHYVTATTGYDGALEAKFKVDTQAPEEAKDAEGAVPAKQPGNVEEAAGKTNARLQGWAFEIADYKYEAIFKPADSLVQK